MFSKIKEILSSIRFWQVVIAVVAYQLGEGGVISITLAQSIASILGVSVTIGTADKLADKIGGGTYIPVVEEDSKG